MFKVIDNFLQKDHFDIIKNFFMSLECNWYYSKGVAQSNIEEGKYFYMIHTLYENNTPNSPAFNLILPVLQKLNAKSLLRIKANLYPNQGKPVYTHTPHVDYTFPHKAAVLSINSCNGGTIINGKLIKSKENRIVIFDGSVFHSSTTCTDKQVRVNIGFNYIDVDCLNNKRKFKNVF